MNIMKRVTIFVVFLFSWPSFANEFQCLITAETELGLSPPIEGVIKSINVERGDEVERNQVIAKLWADLEEAEVALASAKKEFSLRKVERSKELFADSYISEVKVDEAQTEARLSDLELQRAQARLRLKTLRSPIDGIIISRLVSPGEFVSGSEIVRIANLDPLYVEVVLPTSEFGKVSEGAIANVFPESPADGKYSAEVIVVDPVIDAASGTFGVRLKLPNPDNALPSGLNCRVEFNPAE